MRLNTLLCALVLFGVSLGGLGAGCSAGDASAGGGAGAGAAPVAGAGAGSGAAGASAAGTSGGSAGTSAGAAGGSLAGVGGAAGMMTAPIAGVGGSAGSGDAGAGGAAGTAGMGEAGRPALEGPVLTQGVEVLQVPPGGELTVCTTRVLDNAQEVKVKGVRGYISAGSHHFIVDRAPTDLPIQGLTPCVGLSGTDGTRVLIAEKPETIFAMPQGVGFTLRPRQSLTMEIHYFNPTDAPIDVAAHIEFVLAEGAEADNLKEAAMVFTGNFSIVLQPGPGMIEHFYPVPGTPQLPARVFAMTSHTHSLGVRSTIERVPNAFAPSGEQLHESLDWAEPPLDEYSPELLFTGVDGLRLRCEYNNTRDRPVLFGTSVNDEMCFMWLYYYY